MPNSTNDLIGPALQRVVMMGIDETGKYVPFPIAEGGQAMSNATNLHSALSGLSANDHPQYALLTASNIFTGTAQSMKALKLLDTGLDHYITIATASNEVADRALTIPALGGNDTLATIGLAQTFSGANTFSAFNQFSAARKMKAANQTNATATFANDTHLQFTVVNGRKYSFQLIYIFSDSTAADGIQLDFNGGTATATNFVASAVLYDQTNVITFGSSGSLAGILNKAVLNSTGTSLYTVYGSFEPSSNGTFIPRIAQNSHSTGTLTILRGSYMWVEDMP